MNFTQKLRRIQQQGGFGWNQIFDAQKEQYKIIKKLYSNNGFDITMTCVACPEQYEVFKDGEQVGYLRLRHGEFRIDFPSVNNETILEDFPDGDGAFEKEERFKYLVLALRTIQKKLQ